MPALRTDAPTGLTVRILTACVRFYQRRISPLFPPRCRFSPTCSDYFTQAVQCRGPFVGVLLGLWRILRCNPWSRGGVDPVPPVPAPKSVENSRS